LMVTSKATASKGESSEASLMKFSRVDARRRDESAFHQSPEAIVEHSFWQGRG
jgi:hypothetical protein